MNSKSRPKPLLMSAVLAGALAVFAATAGAAQHFPKEGKFAYTGCWSGSTKTVVMSKHHAAWSFEMTGEDVADKPGGMFDHNTLVCEGAGNRSGKAVTNRLTCVVIDPDGDKHMESYTLGKDGKYQRKELAGTGKYVGFETRADLQHLGPFPTIKPGTFQDCNHVVGTYKLK